MLVAESDRDFRDPLRAMLEADGALVVAVSDGRQAIEVDWRAACFGRRRR